MQWLSSSLKSCHNNNSCTVYNVLLFREGGLPYLVKFVQENKFNLLTSSELNSFEIANNSDLNGSVLNTLMFLCKYHENRLLCSNYYIKKVVYNYY